MPALVAQLRTAVGGDAATHVHWGATSQDIMDTALALRLRRVLAIWRDRIDAILSGLAALADRGLSASATPDGEVELEHEALDLAAQVAEIVPRHGGVDGVAAPSPWRRGDL